MRPSGRWCQAFAAYGSAAHGSSSETAHVSGLQVRTFPPRASQTSNVFGNAFKIVFYSIFVNSLTPFNLAAHLNCSQITSILA